MNGSGIWLLGIGFALLALFPFWIYSFFWLVVLDRKSEGLIDDLNNANAFEIKSVRDQLKGPTEVKETMRARYGYKRFAWPISLLVFFNGLFFSMVWDVLRHRFATDEIHLDLLYPMKFVAAVELPLAAFIGVFLFNASYMLRRLFVWDLTTPVFWSALQRTWLVIAVASVLTISMPSGSISSTSTTDHFVRLHAIFFAIGFIVNEVLGSLIDRSREHLKIKRMSVQELPLSLIQGMNFWHEYRLTEEGVENIQNLATADVIDLAVATRYNLRMLLDWMDQSILIHRMGQKAIKLRDEGFITGAIDMAWASPQNSDGNLSVAADVAKTVGAEAVYVSTLMNSLYQDAQIALLWDLWQSQLDSKLKDKNVL
jgi:hypothetical protein